MRPFRSQIPWVALLGAVVGIACSDEPASPPAPSQPAGASAGAVSPTDRQSGSAPSAAAPSTATPAAQAEPQRSQDELIAAGRSVYNANCIACHAMDPTREGALGPAVAGASYELLHARVVEGGYPEGYTPKRDTRVMVALPHLERDLDELAAYLGSL